MGAQQEALAHLSKAREFLDAAVLELDLDMSNAAASSAVLAGINAKDAIRLQLTGRTGKSDDHRTAAPELAAAGPAGKALETTFRRLLGMKTAAAYLAAGDQQLRRSQGRRLGRAHGGRRPRSGARLSKIIRTLEPSRGTGVLIMVCR